MAKKRRGKRRALRSIKVNLALIAALAAVLAALVVAVHFFRAEPVILFPGDFDTRMAMRADAENNACYTLDAARKLLPPLPPGTVEIPMPEHPEKTVPFTPALDPLSRRLEIGRPSDHEDFKAYIEGCRPAIEKIYSALEQPYFLFPEPPALRWAVRMSDRDTQVFSVAAVAALCDYESGGDAAALAEAYAKLIRIARMYSVEGDINYSTERHPEMLLYGDLRYRARKGMPPEHLSLLRESLEALGPPFPDRRARLDNLWRRYDATQLSPMPESYQKFPESIGARLFLIQVRKMAGRVIENREQYNKLIEMCPSQLRDWRSKQPEDEPMRRRHGLLFPLARIDWLLTGIATYEAYYRATILAFALEEYRAANGNFPETLGALAPGILETVPEDPIACAPFVYRRDGANFVLYSLGEDGEDDNGARHRDVMLVSKTSP